MSTDEFQMPVAFDVVVCRPNPDEPEPSRTFPIPYRFAQDSTGKGPNNGPH